MSKVAKSACAVVQHPARACPQVRELLFLCGCRLYWIVAGKKIQKRIASVD